MDAVLGIDIAKAKFDVALQGPDGRVRRKSCANTPAGFRELEAWLGRHGVTHVHACLEATGAYGDALATWLYDAGHRVSVVNPMMIHAFAASQLSRTKTDRTDAALIARFCATQQPSVWTPTPREIRELQALVRRLEALHEMRTQETNRLASGAATTAVERSITTVIETLTDEIAAVQQQIRDHFTQHPGLRSQRDLLTSIPGIGETTAAVLTRGALRQTLQQRAASRRVCRRRPADCGIGHAAPARPTRRKSARVACGRRSIFRRSPRCAAIPRCKRYAAACAPREKCRWSSSARPCANSSTLRMAC